MAEMGEVAMSMYEQVAAHTAPVEAGFYSLLDSLDQYRELLERLIAELSEAAEPNGPLIKRFRAFMGRADAMTQILEDDVLTEMLSMLDRLHAVKDTEEGNFI